MNFKNRTRKIRDFRSRSKLLVVRKRAGITFLFLSLGFVPFSSQALDRDLARSALPSSPEREGSERLLLQPLSLDEAINEALTNSPKIQQAQASSDETHWKKLTTLGQGFLPKISAAANHYFDVTKYTLSNIVFAGQEVILPGIFPNNQISLSASIPIFDGLSNIFALKAALLNEDAADQELNFARFDLSQQIKLVFYQALAASALEDVALENVKILEDHLRQIVVQRQGGAATQYDSLRVEVQMNEARLDAVDAQDNLQLARKKLTQLMGRDDDTRVLFGELPVPDRSRVKNVTMENAFSDRQDVQALNMRAQALDKLHTAQSTWMVPSVSVSGQYIYYDLLLYNGDIIDRHNYQKAYNVGVFFTWNLFDGGISYFRSREASAKMSQAEKATEAARLQIPYDFTLWKKKVLSYSDRYQSKQMDVKRSQESVRLAKEEHKAGTRTSTEVLDAELDLFRSRAAVVNAQVNAAEALIRLELAIGRKI